MIVKIHSGPEALRRFRIRKGLLQMASKRHNRITRTGFRYELLITDQHGRKYRETVNVSRRNDKAVTDGILKAPNVARVQIRGLCRCIYGMQPDQYYAQAEILQMVSVYID